MNPDAERDLVQAGPREGHDAPAPAPEIHSRILPRLLGTPFAREHLRIAATLRLEVVGPRAGEVREHLGETLLVFAVLADLHRRIWGERLPRADEVGVLSPALTQLVLDAYAAELADRGLGHRLELPLEFSPEQPPPELPGLAASIRLLVQPASGRGMVFVSFLVDPAA